MSQSQNRQFRWVFESGKDDRTVNVNELMCVGYDRFSEASFLSDHAHDNCYEIVYVESGKVSWEVNGELYTTQASQLFYTRPNESHRAMMNYIEPCTIWWFIFQDPDSVPGWLGLKKAERKRIAGRLGAMPRTLHADSSLRHIFRKLKAAIQSDDHRMKGIYIRHYTLDVLLNVLQPGPSEQPSLQILDDMLHIKKQIEDDPEKRWTNGELARQVGVSESHFYKLFRDIHGQSPARFMDRTRVEYACELLKSTAVPITTLALDLGFKTSQHFATVFKKYKGLTPSEWRKKRQ